MKTLNTALTEEELFAALGVSAERMPRKPPSDYFSPQVNNAESVCGKHSLARRGARKILEITGADLSPPPDGSDPLARVTERPD